MRGLTETILEASSSDIQKALEVLKGSFNYDCLETELEISSNDMDYSFTIDLSKLDANMLKKIMK